MVNSLYYDPLILMKERSQEFEVGEEELDRKFSEEEQL